MGLLEPAIVSGYLADELPPLLDLARGHRLEPNWDESNLSFSVRLRGRSDNEGATEDYLLVGFLDDYRLLPPMWRFLDPRTAEKIGPPAFPHGNWAEGSVLHPSGVICAPWSRDAYKAHDGPHQEWDDLTAWETIGQETQSKALTLPDMFARLYAELRQSERRMAPLPPLAEAAA
jgi:hypothetical protein